MQNRKAIAERQTVRLRTSDVDEAVAAVSSVYCAHCVRIVGSSLGMEARLDARSGERQQFVNLSYAAPVQIDAGNFDGLMLMMTCEEGQASVKQNGRFRGWTRGRTMPLSPGLKTKLEFDRSFRQHSVRLDIPFMEQTCSRLLNRSLDVSLRFQLEPFSESLESLWQQGIQMLLKMPCSEAGPSSAMLRLEEALAVLVLENHPHNYSVFLSDCRTAVPPRIVREAEDLMRSGPLYMTVGNIAKALGVSLRSLELGFREWKASSPSEFMRRLRLDAAKAQLQNPSETTTVTSVAVSNGFMHLARFSSYYRTVFEELPSETLRRNQHRLRTSAAR